MRWCLQKDEFLRLAINAIHNDLISRNEAFQSLALTFVSNSKLRLSAPQHQLQQSAPFACTWVPDQRNHLAAASTWSSDHITYDSHFDLLWFVWYAVSGPEMAEALTPDVLKLLVSAQPQILPHDCLLQAVLVRHDCVRHAASVVHQ